MKFHSKLKTLVVRFCTSLLVVLSFLTIGCGKKGPLLPPFVQIPSSVTEIVAERKGDDVFVTLVVPSENVDGSEPVSISRVEVYSFTGRTAPPRRRWGELGKLVQTISVQDITIKEIPSVSSEHAEAVLAGSSVTVHEILTVDSYKPSQTSLLKTESDEVVSLNRFYMAVGFSSSGESGPVGTVASVSLTALPAPPTAVRTLVRENEIRITWEPSGGLIGFLLERALPQESLPLGVVANSPENPLLEAEFVLPTPTRYNIYRVVENNPLALLPMPEVSSWLAGPPAPLNLLPIVELEFTDTVMFDRRHCYFVRAVKDLEGSLVESKPSTPVCMTPVDIFPPAAPQSLAAIVSGEGIGLIWESNKESDLGGYLVLRRESSDATLQTLTSAPIIEARYQDDDVVPGVAYSYTVVAVDERLPLPNVSEESNRVVETAR